MSQSTILFDSENEEEEDTQEDVPCGILWKVGVPTPYANDRPPRGRYKHFLVSHIYSIYIQYIFNIYD